MIESLLTWLMALPPVAVYGVIALLAVVENLFPPFPADTGIAIGAFLAHRGVTQPWIVLTVVLVANTGGAMAIYLLAARHSSRLLRSRMARAILSENALARVRSEYDRFGTTGLFLTRLLPGVRAVVPPFAGLIHLGAWRVAAVVLVAGAVWYGAIIFIATKLGENLDWVVSVIGSMNRVTGVVAVIGVVGVVWWIARRKRTGDRD